MYSLILMALLLVSNVAFADNCSITNIKDFYTQVKSYGPTLQEAISKREEVTASIDVAKQRPNPQLNFEYLKGDQFGVNVGTYTLSALHVYEYGDKRDKRIDRAKSFEELQKSKIDVSLVYTNLHATIEYQRIAQLNIVISTVKEAIDTFHKIIRKFSSRKRLNPAETISLATLRLATNGYKAQLNDLENEKTILKGKISFISNCNKITSDYQYLNFKNLKGIAHFNTNSGLIKIEDFKMDLAQKEFEIQKSLGYSNISVGPSFEFQQQGNDQYVSGGVAVNFALPLFQTNNGGKLRAIRKVVRQNTQSQNRKRSLMIKRENLVSKFNRSLATLSKMPKLKTLVAKHHKVEKLFLRGIVSIPMTIEAHRQQVSFLKSRFGTENDILDALINISLIDGNPSLVEELFK